MAIVTLDCRPTTDDRLRPAKIRIHQTHLTRRVACQSSVRLLVAHIPLRNNVAWHLNGSTLDAPNGATTSCNNRLQLELSFQLPILAPLQPPTTITHFSISISINISIRLAHQASSRVPMCRLHSSPLRVAPSDFSQPKSPLGDSSRFKSSRVSSVDT